MEEEQEGTYRALPRVDDDIKQFILQEDSGPVAEFGEALSELGIILRRVDEEMTGLSDANPNMAEIVYGTVEGINAALSDQLRGEQSKAFLRAIGYVNAFVVLRTLDMQWRRMQPP